MLQALWAKLTPGERLVVYGAPAVLAGWIAGIVAGNVDFGYSSYNYFTEDGSIVFTVLAILAAAIAVAALYVRHNRTNEFTWPVPYPHALLALAAGSLAAIAAGVVFQLIDAVPDKPALMFVADAAMLAGAGTMTFGAWRLWAAEKAEAAMLPTAPAISPVTPTANPPTTPPTV